jgi:hypothetical protein
MHRYADFLIAVIYLAVIFVLVRPGSQGPGLVTAFGNSTSGLVKAATGGGTWSGA